MPIWIKFIFMLWICFVVMQILAMIYADDIRQKISKAKIPGVNLPWYLYIYAISFLLCIFSIIPIGVWFIFLR